MLKLKDISCFICTLIILLRRFFQLGFGLFDRSFYAAYVTSKLFPWFVIKADHNFPFVKQNFKNNSDKFFSFFMNYFYIRLIFNKVYGSKGRGNEIALWSDILAEISLGTLFLPLMSVCLTLGSFSSFRSLREIVNALIFGLIPEEGRFNPFLRR